MNAFVEPILLRRLLLAVTLGLALFVGCGGAIRTLDIGDYKTCVVLLYPEGALKCWGMAVEGQLGLGDMRHVGGTPQTTPLKLPAVQTGGHVRAVSAGYKHTCALMDNGGVRCWGLGMSGRLGYGSEQSLGGTPGTVPAAVGDVPLDVRADAVACGTATTCVLHSGGRVRCWGLGYKGALGLGHEESVGHIPTQLPRDTPDVDVGGRVLDIAVSAHACVLVATSRDASLGTLRCWGPNHSGQLGYGHTLEVGATPDLIPSAVGDVPIGALVRQFDVGLYHTCVVTEDFRLRCWGGNEFGQLGYGREGDLGATPDTTPEKMGDIDVGPRRVLRVACGAWHTCVLLDDHRVKCWGRGETASGPAGAIGYGDDKFMSPYGYLTVKPSQLRTLPVGGKVALIRAGRGHTCAVLLDEDAAEDDEVASSRIRCWGWNSFGQLGYGHRRSVGADSSFLPSHAGDVPVDPVKHDPWMIISAEHELARQPYGAHGALLPFGRSSTLWGTSMSSLAALVLVAGGALCALFLFFRRRSAAAGGASLSASARSQHSATSTTTLTGSAKFE